MAAALFEGDTDIGRNPQTPVANRPAPSSGTRVNVVNSP